MVATPPGAVRPADSPASEPASDPAGATLEAFYIASGDGVPLFGCWRPPASGTIERVCVVAPPFGEEEKCARRVLTALLQDWHTAGVASLLPSLRGTGDAGGQFATATLTDWRADLRAACDEARRRAPGAALCVLGVRLGAALALQIADAVGADALILLEPVLDGRRYLSQLEGRRRLRAQMTKAEGESTPDGSASATSTNPERERAGFPPPAGGGTGGTDIPAASLPDDPQHTDLDGWALSETLREEIRALNVTQPAQFAGQSLVVQIGPRAEIAPPLRDFAERLGASTRAVVMPAFWNANDELAPAPLLEALPADLWKVANRTNFAASASAPGTPLPDSPSGEYPVIFHNDSSQRLVGVWHEPQGGVSGTTLIMLHGWSGYRIGPHQMLTRAAREFARQGCGVLRFDFAGRGDSDGETTQATLATMRRDTLAALRWCRDQKGSQRFILIGICAGCEIAFACAGEAGVAGLAFWSAPVLAADESSERASKRRAHFLRKYAGKLLRPETWRKLLTGRVDTRGVGNVLSGRNAGELKNAEGSEPGKLPSGWKADALDGFHKARRPCLFTYGTNDPTAPEAEAWYRARCEAAGITPLLRHIEGANHSYYGLNWEREVFEVTRVWLKDLPISA